MASRFRSCARTSPSSRVVLPPGEHRVELAYRPASFRIGLGLSAAGLLGVLALSLAGPPGGRGR